MQRTKNHTNGSNNTPAKDLLDSVFRSLELLQNSPSKADQTPALGKISKEYAKAAKQCWRDSFVPFLTHELVHNGAPVKGTYTSGKYTLSIGFRYQSHSRGFNPYNLHEFKLIACPPKKGQKNAEDAYVLSIVLVPPKNGGVADLLVTDLTKTPHSPKVQLPAEKLPELIQGIKSQVHNLSGQSPPTSQNIIASLSSLDLSCLIST